MKTKKSKKVKTGRVSAITVSRLYNTGNYTNVKYDLTCQVEKGQSASQTLLQMVRILSSLRPVREPECLAWLETARKTPPAERSNFEKENFDKWVKIEKDHLAVVAARNRAITSMDAMGGDTTARDAKLSWDDNDTPW